jgi:hypothetical protein
MSKTKEVSLRKILCAHICADDGTCWGCCLKGKDTCYVKVATAQIKKLVEERVIPDEIKEIVYPDGVYRLTERDNGHNACRSQAQAKLREAK